MKQPFYILLGIIFMCTFSSCAYQRLGDLTMISSRNVDSNTEYKLIQKYVVATAKTSNGNSLEVAIDNAVKKVPDGEFLKNVRVYVKGNGKRVKVEGDVWGIPSMERNVTKSVNEKVEFKQGDRVTFKNSLGKFVEGTILGLNQNTAIIEHRNNLGQVTKSEIEYEKLTKIN